MGVIGKDSGDQHVPPQGSQSDGDCVATRMGQQRDRIFGSGPTAQPTSGDLKAVRHIRGANQPASTPYGK
jgi:hypothetical protein